MACYNLNEEEKQNCKRIFSYFEHKNDGLINKNDVGMVLRASGRNPTEEELNEILNDFEKCNKITFSQILVMMDKTFKHDQGESDDFNEEETIEREEEALVEAFSIFDKAKDGFIGVRELRRIITDLGEGLSNEEADNLIKQADKSKNGQVDYREFSKLIIKSMK
ncbi:DgyrCDS6902 [Dimorphilus gyrociliatus]|uniref:DgyrCDS6902 n=1 Tax=Dimorphilus gyrociliatus TaxID=2664684 RepID=A0A7I8VR19_9ANNE|nr:DgyrCDS6902 [Dimorphilus gyrociliatus]